MIMYLGLYFLQIDGVILRKLGLEPLSGNAIYDIDKIVKVLIAQEDSTWEAPVEYIDDNVLNAQVGKNPQYTFKH